MDDRDGLSAGCVGSVTPFAVVWSLLPPFAAVSVRWPPLAAMSVRLLPLGYDGEAAEEWIEWVVIPVVKFPLSRHPRLGVAL